MTIPYETPTPGIEVEITGSPRALRGLAPPSEEELKTLRDEAEALRRRKLGLLGRIWEWVFGYQGI